MPPQSYLWAHADGALEVRYLFEGWWNVAVKPCPNCGNPETLCCGLEVGALSIVTDRFTHWCLNCGYIEVTVEGGGEPGPGTHYNTCPYCEFTGQRHGPQPPVDFDDPVMNGDFLGCSGSFTKLIQGGASQK